MPYIINQNPLKFIGYGSSFFTCSLLSLKTSSWKGYLSIDESMRSIIAHDLYSSGSSRNLTIPSFWLIVAYISPSWIYNYVKDWNFELPDQKAPNQSYKPIFFFKKVAPGHLITIWRTCISASLGLFNCTLLAMPSRDRVKYVWVNLCIFLLYMDDTTCLTSPKLLSWKARIEIYNRTL